MSLIFTRREFIECPACKAKPGSPALCVECLERRELYEVVESIRDTRVMSSKLADAVSFCKHCKDGNPDLYCPKHGR